MENLLKQTIPYSKPKIQQNSTAIYGTLKRQNRRQKALIDMVFRQLIRPPAVYAGGLQY